MGGGGGSGMRNGGIGGYSQSGDPFGQNSQSSAYNGSGIGGGSKKVYA
jgi:hypothetical protein